MKEPRDRGLPRGLDQIIDTKEEPPLTRRPLLRTSTLHRDLSYTPGASELERPAQWTSDWVQRRLVEAFVIERRIPDKRIGPALVRSHWASIATTDSFADRVHQGELARQHVWQAWARASGALPYEVSRMEEALSWPGLVLSNGHAAEGRVLLAWAFTTAYGRSLRDLLRKRGWSRATFYRAVDRGSARIADYLNKRAVAVR